ncbi:hypothetical protein VNO77_41013 [Canavalia gladiata]|uniref:Uncharacterized protein n=1 Tax=Canavalia gladiata TaxID=3824 RepID=A0AAN9JYZ0_CANGL
MGVPAFPCSSVRKNTESNLTLCPNAKTSSPSHDSVPISNQQQQPSIVQWPYMPQNATEQFLSMHFPTLTPSPGAFNQWQQFQQGQLFAQSTPPFWQPQQTVAGGPSLGANVPTIAPSSTTHTLVPNMCYPYSFPGFSGPWNPSSCLGQLYQMQHPYAYSFPGALTFSSAAPRMPGCSASGEHSFQIGIIRPAATLPQEHQQLWEAQSVENVQLRSEINKLQAEVSDYMDRIKKLEEEVSSLKQKVPTDKVIGTIPVRTRLPAKRGRSKRSLISLDALHGSHPQTGSRKPVLNNPQFVSKSPIFEKVILKKVENKEIPFGSTTTVQRENNNKILNAVKDMGCNIQINQSNPIMAAYQGQGQVQACGSGPALSFPSRVNVNFANEEEEGPEDAIVRSGNNENEEEMGDDTSSAAEESGVIEYFGSGTMDHYIPSSPKFPSPECNW